MKMTIEHIKEALFTLVNEDDGSYITYCGAKGFTSEVKKAMKALETKCQVESHPEYYRIDYTYWDRLETEGQCDQTWNLRALIEHENNNKDWDYEVKKLAPFRCPLRVVIGYRDKQQSDEEQLNRVCKTLAAMKDAGCFCEEGEFWVVLGNTGRGKANYKFYKYERENNCFDIIGV